MEELPPEGKLELSRRMNVYSAVVNGLSETVPQLVWHDKQLKVFEGSKSFWIEGGFVLIVFLGSLWGGYFWFAAIVAALVALRVWAEEKSHRNRTVMEGRIRELRCTWIAGGLRSMDFDSLFDLAKRNHGYGLRVFEKEYLEWWDQLKANVEQDIRSILDPQEMKL